MDEATLRQRALAILVDARPDTAATTAAATWMCPDVHSTVVEVLRQFSDQLGTTPIFFGSGRDDPCRTPPSYQAASQIGALSGAQRDLLPTRYRDLLAAGLVGLAANHDFKRIEAPGYQPYPQAEAIARTLHLLQLALPGEARPSTAPLPAESVADLIARGRALNAQEAYGEALPLFQRAT
jgi:hypothetical protein